MVVETQAWQRSGSNPNVRAEQEIAVILLHLEYQNDLLLNLTQRFIVEVSQTLDRNQ
jgi:hypothetical protein